MGNESKVIAIVAATLGIRPEGLDAHSRLLGAIPELDSMAVATLITTLEERYGFSIDDDEIDGSVFATIGSLVKFVEAKLDA